MDVSNSSAAALAQGMLGEVFADGALRRKHAKKREVQARARAEAAAALGAGSAAAAAAAGRKSTADLPHATPGDELARDFFDLDEHVSKHLNDNSSGIRQDEKAADRLGPLLARLMEVYDASNRALRRLVIGGDDENKYSNIITSSNEEFVSLCKDMISEVSRAHKGKINNQKKLLQSMRDELISYKEAEVRMKYDGEEQLRKLQEMQYERDLLKGQVTALEGEIVLGKDRANKLEIQAKYDQKLIEQLRVAKGQMAGDLERIRHELNEKFEIERKLLRSQLQSAQTRAEEAEAQVKSMYLQQQSTKKASKIAGSSEEPKERVLRRPAGASGSGGASTTTSSGDNDNNDGPSAQVSMSSLISGSLSDMKMPKTSSSTQTMVDDMGLWDAAQARLLAPSEASAAVFKNLVMGATMRHPPINVSMSAVALAQDKFDRPDEENEKIFSESAANGAGNWVPASLAEGDKVKPSKSNGIMYRWVVPKPLLQFMVNLPITIQAQPVRPLKWCIAQIHRILSLKYRYDSLDSASGALLTQSLVDFLIEFALVESSGRQGAETYLYWLIYAMKRYTGHSTKRGKSGSGQGTNPLLHCFARFLEFFDPLPPSKSIKGKGGDANSFLLGAIAVDEQDKIKTVGAPKTSANKTAGSAQGSSKLSRDNKIEEEDEIDRSSGHTKDHIKIKISDCSLSGNMLSAYMFVRYAMLAPYDGLYNSKSNSNSGTTLDFIWNSKLQRKRRKTFERESSKSSVESYAEDNASGHVTAMSDELEDEIKKMAASEAADKDDDDADAAAERQRLKDSGHEPIIPGHVLLDDMFNMYVPLDRVLKVITHSLSFMSESVLTSLVREIEYNCTKIVNTSHVVNGGIKGDHARATSAGDSISHFGELQTPEGNHSIIREATRKIQICESLFRMSDISGPSAPPRPPDLYRELSWEHVEKATTRANSTAVAPSNQNVADTDISNAPTIKNIIVLVHLDRTLQLVIEALLIRYNFINIKLQHIFTEGDINKDGKLNFPEFKAIVSKISNGITGRNTLKMFRDSLMSTSDNSETIDSVTFSNTCKKFGLIQVIDTATLRNNQLRVLFQRPVPPPVDAGSSHGAARVNNDLLTKFSGKTRNGFQTLQGISALLMHQGKKIGKLVSPDGITHMGGVVIDNSVKIAEVQPTLPSIPAGTSAAQLSKSSSSLTANADSSPSGNAAAAKISARLLAKLKPKINFTFDTANESTPSNANPTEAAKPSISNAIESQSQSVKLSGFSKSGPNTMNVIPSSSANNSNKFAHASNNSSTSNNNNSNNKNNNNGFDSDADSIDDEDDDLDESRDVAGASIAEESDESSDNDSFQGIPDEIESDIYKGPAGPIRSVRMTPQGSAKAAIESRQVASEKVISKTALPMKVNSDNQPEVKPNLPNESSTSVNRVMFNSNSTPMMSANADFRQSPRSQSESKQNVNVSSLTGGLLAMMTGQAPRPKGINKELSKNASSRIQEQLKMSRMQREMNDEDAY